VKTCTKCGGPGPFARRSDKRHLDASWCKSCRKKTHQEWVARNRERIREYHREYNRKWREKHREKMLAKDREYRAKNPDRVREILRRSQQKNPEPRRQGAARRRARKAMVESTLTTAQWFDILDIFHHRCAYCLRTDVALHKDHVIAISRGGGNVEENVVPCCKRCNSQKKDRPVFMMARFIG
jgi:5-methylcytosine-specific restriction endonuclease McrA